MDKYDEIAARLAGYGVPNAGPIVYSAKQAAELVAEAACARHMTAILARAVGAPGSATTEWADEVRRIAREEIGRWLAEWAPTAKPENRAPTPAADEWAQCKLCGANYPANSHCLNDAHHPKPATEPVRPEHVFVDTSKREWRAYRAVLPPLVLPEYLRADVVEKRVAEAVAAYRASEEGSGWWHGVGSALGCNSGESLISAAIRVIAERDEARASLAAAEARVRELEIDRQAIHDAMCEAAIEVRDLKGDFHAAVETGRRHLRSAEAAEAECHRVAAQHEANERALANLRTELVEYLAANADSDARREADAKEMAELRADRDEYRRVYHAMCDAMKVKA